MPNAVDEPNAPPQRAARKRRVVAILAVGAVCIGGLATAGVVYATSRHAPPGTLTPLVVHTALPTLPPDLRLVEEFNEGLVSDPIEMDTMNWLTALQSAVARDPNFGTIAISPDRATVTITWFGEPSAQLRQQTSAAPEGVTVVIQPTNFRPAELQELVTKAMSPDVLPGIRITMGGAENDGSGLRFGVWELPNGSTPSTVAEHLAAAIGRPDVPIRIEIAQVVPAHG